LVENVKIGYQYSGYNLVITQEEDEGSFFMLKCNWKIKWLQMRKFMDTQYACGSRIPIIFDNFAKNASQVPGFVWPDAP
jgi:hypothetical protein